MASSKRKPMSVIKAELDALLAAQPDVIEHVAEVSRVLLRLRGEDHVDAAAAGQGLAPLAGRMLAIFDGQPATTGYGVLEMWAFLNKTRSWRPP